ncbi:energy transducer TonB [Sediminibacter sp. Hel_I_10]|uniref:energy transducer TonB family protein n=1 Tax=Sediminibacter sp. Hel_I_10 TaxID=1392490 RepID=UPI00047A2759|nr:energy transducer TonB [Sediminibacter sp. Hel_I_10]
MNFIEKHKALLITVLISGTVLMTLFSMRLTKEAEFLAESFYEIEPQTAEELEALEAEKALENAKSATNQAFNEDEEFKEMMRNFKTVNTNQVNETKAKEAPAQEEASETPDNVLTANASSANASKNYAVKEKERQSFNKAKDILAMHSPEKNKDNSDSNKSSTVSFSLKNRTKVKLPPPVYLCETTGKIVVNITVNADGQVTDTYINSSSSSDNKCLIENALDYAKNALFSQDPNTKSQIGSITYYFIGKN